MIPKAFSICCDLYEFGGKLNFDISMWGGGRDVDDLLIQNSLELKEIKKELEQKLNEIKTECNNLGIDSDVFITKIIFEIDMEEKNIKDIIE